MKRERLRGWEVRVRRREAKRCLCPGIGVDYPTEVLGHGGISRVNHFAKSSKIE